MSRYIYVNVPSDVDLENGLLFTSLLSFKY